MRPIISQNEVTAIIQIYYMERLKYLIEILDHIKRGSFVPGTIMLWANKYQHRDLWHSLDEADLKIVCTDFNTLTGRYAAALVAKTPYIFVQDDDLTVGKHTIRDLVQEAAEGGHIAGIAGKDLKLSSKPYTDGKDVSKGRADMALGRCWAAHRSCLVPGINYIMQNSFEVGRCDDIIFNLTSGGANIIEPKADNVINNLDEEGKGLSHEPNHYNERNEVAYKVMKELMGGWSASKR